MLESLQILQTEKAARERSAQSFLPHILRFLDIPAIVSAPRYISIIFHRLRSLHRPGKAACDIARTRRSVRLCHLEARPQLPSIAGICESLQSVKRMISHPDEV